MRCHRWRYRSAKFVDIHLSHLLVSSFAPLGIDQDSLHRHHEVELFSFRSSSRTRGIPLDPACQFTARMMSKTQLTSCKRARSAEARSPYRILAVAYVLRLLRGLYSIPHYISAEAFRASQLLTIRPYFANLSSKVNSVSTPFTNLPTKIAHSSTNLEPPSDLSSLRSRPL